VKAIPSGAARAYTRKLICSALDDEPEPETSMMKLRLRPRQGEAVVVMSTSETTVGEVLVKVTMHRAVGASHLAPHPPPKKKKFPLLTHFQYAASAKVPQERLRCQWDGDFVDADQTVGELGLEDGDVIDVVVD
jgi:hypothetical protein